MQRDKAISTILRIQHGTRPIIPGVSHTTVQLNVQNERVSHLPHLGKVGMGSGFDSHACSKKKIQRHHLPKGKGFEAADDRMTSESIESIGPGELTLEKRGDTEVNGKQILQLGRPKQDDLAYLIRTYLGR